MEAALVIVLFLLGIVLIVKGGDFFVDAATWIAEVSGVPKFIVGATVVSIATTLPELLVSLVAAAAGKVDMAVGNAVGSVTANTGLILAISIFAMPVAIRRKEFGFKGVLLLLSTLALLIFSVSGRLTAFGSLILLVLLVCFAVENIQAARQESDTVRVVVKGKKDVALHVAGFIFGAAGIVVGAQLLVDNGSRIAEMLGVPEAIIAVTMVAIGTSLPELVTTVTAIVKKQSSLSIGNLLGANIIDITLILPLCSLVSGQALPIAQQSISLDMPVCLAEICIGVIPTLIFGKFRRWQAVVMIGLYIAYLGLLFI